MRLAFRLTSFFLFQSVILIVKQGFSSLYFKLKQCRPITISDQKQVSHPIAGMQEYAF